MSASQVIGQFNTANSFASQATSRAEQFITALNKTVEGLNTPAAPLEVEFPTKPDALTKINIALSEPPSNFPNDDSGGAPANEAIDVPDFGTAPTSPSYSWMSDTGIGAGLTPPEDLTLPDRTISASLGAWTAPTTPPLLSINVRPFEGINSHADWLARLDQAPSDLVLAAPTGFVPPAPPKYDSDMMKELIADLRKRMKGGTGLDATVEQAIFDRDRSRVAAAADAGVADAVRNAEARGFALPSGAMFAQIREAQKTALGKTAEAAHDIAFKQAELEQANLKQAIEQGIALESRLIDYANSIEQRGFEAAKFVAENAVMIHNALVEKYRVLLQKYQAFADVYRTLIEAEKTKVEVYRADIEAEKAKAEINTTLIEQTKLQIDMRNAAITAYRAELEGAQVLLSMDKLKIELFGERVRAYAAEVSAESVKVEAEKAAVQRNESVASIHRSNVEAYVAQVGGRVQVAQAKASVYETKIKAYAAKVQAFGSRVAAEAERVRSLTTVQELKLSHAKAEIEQNLAEAQRGVELYKANLAQYEAAKSLSLQHAKLLSDQYMTIKQILMDASKVGAQVNAQMAASAYGTIRAGADISSRDDTSIQYQYGGETSDKRAAPTFTS